MSLTPLSLIPPFAGFEAALIDFDGTIAVSHHIWSQVDRIFLEKRGIPYDPAIGAELAALGFAEGAVYIIDKYGLDEKPGDICDEWNELARDLYRDEVELRPGARAYIDALKRAGIKTALVTTNDPGVLASLKPRIDVDELFDARVYGCEVNVGKTQPDIYLEAARRLGVAPGRCVVFEDIPHGLDSAGSVGMRTVGLASDDPVQNLDEMRKHAEKIVNEWTDLL
jgi:HAD superfamily hydrolase (TIGR01509 family)